LLKNIKEIKYLVIPYINPLGRLLLALKNINSSDRYIQFLKNPLSYLYKFENIKKIIILVGQEGKKEFFESQTNDNENNNDTIVELEDNSKIIDKIEKEEDYKLDSKKYKIKNHFGFIKFDNLWFFRLFNYKPKIGDIDRFKECLRQKGKKFANISDTLKLFEKRERLKLKDCYKKITGGINNSSIVVYHQPIQKIIYTCVTLSFNKCKKQIFGFKGQLLTGDINLQKYPLQIEREGYIQFRSHYHYYLDKISLFQIPHHGSINNWNNALLQDLPRCNIWISSSRKSHPTHPCPIIIKEISKEGRIFIWNHEKNEVTFYCTMANSLS